jgi:hypothetical protein
MDLRKLKTLIDLVSESTSRTRGITEAGGRCGSSRWPKDTAGAGAPVPHYAPAPAGHPGYFHPVAPPAAVTPRS